MDYAPEALRQSGRLFGWVLEVARRALDLRQEDDAQRFNTKVELIWYLFQQGIAKKKIRDLLDFITAYLPFEKSDFKVTIQQITKSRQPMGIREAILNDAREQGIEQGIQKGVKQGLEQGFQEKERIVVTRAWKKGMSLQDIADLADMPVERVEVIISHLPHPKIGNLIINSSCDL